MEVCFVEDCQRKPAFSCYCQDKVDICFDHIGNHMMNEGNHKMTRLTFVPSKSNIEPLVKKYKDIIVFYNQIMLNTRDYCNSIIENLNANYARIFKEINELKCLANSVIKNLLKETEFPYPDLIKFKSIIVPDIKLLDLYSMDAYKLSVNKNMNIVFKSIFAIITKYKDFDNNVLRTTTTSKNFLGFISPQHLQRNFIALEKDIFELNTTFCKINKNTYFIYGGSSFPRTPYILNLESNKISEQKAHVPLSSAGASFWNNKIFIFGGTTGNNQYSSSCYRFNIKRNEWFSIASLSVSCEYTTSSCYCSRILVVGMNIKSVLGYDQLKNCFYEFDKLDVPGKRYIFENYVVAENNFLYEIETNSLIVRSKINFEIGSLNIYGSFRREEYIYFVNIDRLMFRINTISMQLQKISYLGQ